MRNTVLLLAGLCICRLSGAAEMVKVPDSEAFCAASDAYCYEWRMLRDDSLRFVAQGYEDGGDFSFYRRNASGEYTRLFQVFPAMQDRRYPRKLFWGYAWDISDVVLAQPTGPIRLLVNFQHDYQDESNWEPDKWQRSVPFVLFKGTTRQPGITAGEQRFRAMTVDEVRSDAAAVR